MGNSQGLPKIGRCSLTVNDNPSITIPWNRVVDIQNSLVQYIDFDGTEKETSITLTSTEKYNIWWNYKNCECFRKSSNQ